MGNDTDEQLKTSPELLCGTWDPHFEDTARCNCAPDVPCVVGEVVGPEFHDVRAAESHESSVCKVGEEAGEQTHYPCDKSDCYTVSCVETMFMSVCTAVQCQGLSVPLTKRMMTVQRPCHECTMKGCKCEYHQRNRDTTGEESASVEAEASGVVRDVSCCTGSLRDDPCAYALNCVSSLESSVVSGTLVDSYVQAPSVSDKCGKTLDEETVVTSCVGGADDVGAKVVPVTTDSKMSDEVECSVGVGLFVAVQSCESPCSVGSVGPVDRSAPDTLATCGSSHHMGTAPERPDMQCEPCVTPGGGCHDNSSMMTGGDFVMVAGSGPGDAAAMESSKVWSGVDVFVLKKGAHAGRTPFEQCDVVSKSVVKSCVQGERANSVSCKVKLKQPPLCVGVSLRVKVAPSGLDDAVVGWVKTKDSVMWEEMVSESQF